MTIVRRLIMHPVTSGALLFVVLVWVVPAVAGLSRPRITPPLAPFLLVFREGDSFRLIEIEEMKRPATEVEAALMPREIAHASTFPVWRRRGGFVASVGRSFDHTVEIEQATAELLTDADRIAIRTLAVDWVIERWQLNAADAAFLRSGDGEVVRTDWGAVARNWTAAAGMLIVIALFVVSLGWLPGAIAQSRPFAVVSAHLRR